MRMGFGKGLAEMVGSGVISEKILGRFSSNHAHRDKYLSVVVEILILPRSVIRFV